MKIEGRRASTNVEDRRKKCTIAKTAGIGIGGIAIALLAWFLNGQAPDLGDVIESVQTTATSYVDEKTEDELAAKCAIFLASTEDFWSEEFEKVGGYYRQPRLVLYSDTVTTGCGHEKSKCKGPFYCTNDQTVYIDVDEMIKRYSAKGDVCDLVYAEIIGYEVGHHVQALRGEFDDMGAASYRYGRESTQYLQAEVRIELLADYYAGCWAHFEKTRFGSVSDEEIRMVLEMMPKKGDDYIQEQSQGYVTPETFTHGTSEQRFRWFKKGLESGDPAAGRVLLTMPYNQI